MPKEQAPEQDKHFLQAHKNVQRGRHQFIMQLARQNFKQAEILPLVTMIDWKSETEWLAQEYREKEEVEKNAPKPVTIPPPTEAPTVQ